MAVLLRAGMLRASALGSTSIADWIDANTRRPNVRRLMRSLARVSAYSSALDLVSADVVLGRLQQNMRHPIHYIDGGWQTLVEGLRQVAIAAGARVRTSASVSEIHVRDGIARAVRLHDGTELGADVVVLALPPADALSLLDRPRLRHHVERSIPTYIACLDVALERLPEPRHPVVIDQLQPRFMTAQSQFARVAPKSGAVIHAFKQLDPREPFSPQQDRTDLEALLDETQPGWRNAAIERRFLPHMLASGALPLAARGGMARRPAPRSEDVPNVYFAGDWVGADGYLVDTALGSARAAAGSILSVSRYARAA
jgi:phytoene dehydrogenase-like protein